jgi:hypothetical protein
VKQKISWMPHAPAGTKKEKKIYRLSMGFFFYLWGGTFGTAATYWPVVPAPGDGDGDCEEIQTRI